MTLLIILGVLFAGLAIMVAVGEKHGKPMTDEQKQKFGKILPILMVIMLVSATFKACTG
ncbi:hypothetical protein [Thalassotalea agarivorans]|uniref:Uncharacterized protein n=1 Tax=Thalassotalea agarivorans TaxID=349064 RepID=A0A1H9YQ76_THASX|nr:hypothetical protein [Thalassotalea agarivorans]SES71292.1 hypothetical protein SAMN05660429_00312 [Thalassotalea agarivorans]